MIPVYKNDKGGVTVVGAVLQENKSNWVKMEHDDWVAHVIDRCIPKGKEYVILEEKDIPTDQTFFNAWRLVDGKIEIDMQAARKIHMDKIRIVRNQELERVDIEIKKWGDIGQDLSALWNERINLRSIPQTFDLNNFTDPESLKNSWPTELPVRQSD